MHCLKPIHGPEIQLSKNHSIESRLFLCLRLSMLMSSVCQQTLRLQQDVSEWLVCLNNVSLFICVVTVTTM